MDEVVFSRPVDGALYAFEKGFQVFPIKPNGKTPVFKGWQSWSESAGERKVRDYGTANPLHNWGVYCGASGLTVIDIDNKPGCQGSKVFEALLSAHEKLPNTLTVQTPTGGFHVYFLGTTKSTIGALGQWIDTRSTGGYVVAPGSRIDDRVYEVVKNGSAAEIPSWLTALLTQPTEPAKPVAQVVDTGERNKTIASLAGSMRARGMEYDEILPAMLAFNERRFSEPLSIEELEKTVTSICKYEASLASAAVDFIETPEKPLAFLASSIKGKELTKRDWIMKHRYIAGFISVIISPGGVGKSVLTMLDAVSIATGKELTGHGIPRSQPVWIYNTEDPQDELRRRMFALCEHHRLDISKLDNVHISSGRDRPLIMAKSDNKGVAVNDKALQSTIHYIRQHSIRVLITDPFVRTHEVKENDNMQIDKVVWCFQHIADATGCAVGLVHHTRKPSADTRPGDMNDARGASSLINAARIAHSISTMSEDAADSFGISDDRRRWYIRFDNAKANLHPPAERADWFEKISVTLPTGDDVGTLQKVPMASMAEQRRQEAEYANERDVATVLGQHMQIGDKLPITEAYELMCENSHLFDDFTSKQAGREALRKMLKRMPQANGKAFSYFFDGSGRTKHLTVCGEAVERDEPERIEPTVKSERQMREEFFG